MHDKGRQEVNDFADTAKVGVGFVVMGALGYVVKLSMY